MAGKKNLFVSICYLAFAFAFISSSCGRTGQAHTPTPTPKMFAAPAGEIKDSIFITISSPDDPTQAHWVDYFGASVDIEGDVLAVGAPIWNSPGEGFGDAYVYRRSAQGEWLQEAVLTASDRDDGFQYDQHFGEAVALNGTLLAVGAPGYDHPALGDNTGAIYIFEYDGSSWVETGKIIASGALSGAKIGRTLVFDGDLLAASGAPEAGIVYIFQREAGQWREIAKLHAPPSLDGKPYHVLMDLYGDTLAFSTVSWQEPKVGEDEEVAVRSLRRTGNVSLYQRFGDEWKVVFQASQQEASLYPMRSDIPFGLPVALGGEAGKAKWLAVGKPGFPKSGREKGSVAIFERGEKGWALQSELMLLMSDLIPGALPFFGPDPGPTFFGAYVDFEGSRLAVISTFANAIYVFEPQDADWVYRFRLIPSFGDDFMRKTVAMSGSSLLLGAPGELGGGSILIFNMFP